MKYPIYSPDIQPYTKSVEKAIADGWISSQGEFIEKARVEASRVLGSPYVVLVNNGTSATHLLYKSLKFKYPEITKIYVPDYVFVAVWNCALYEYSPEQICVLPTDPVTLNPIFSDIEPNSAVVVVHNIGNVINVPELKRSRPDIIIVEDCCEAFLEEYENQKTGTVALCAAVSFFGNKIVTTGEGGLWYTNDKELYDFIYKSCHHGMTSERYIYDVIGYNYRMTNLQAALLYDQLRDIDTILTKKRAVRDNYTALLPSMCITSGLWMNVIRMKGCNYSSISTLLKEHDIDTRPMFYPIHMHKHLRNIHITSTDIQHQEIIMIPSSPSLSVFDQVYIANIIKHTCKGNVPPQIHRITKETRRYLDEFVSQELPSTFRYFSSRKVDECLDNHTLTLIGVEPQSDRPICYAHIDDRWIGICILPCVQGKGYGSLFLDFILDYARLSSISQLRLTVDKDNKIAYAMYLKRGFVVEEVKDTHYLMIKNHDSSSCFNRRSDG